VIDPPGDPPRPSDPPDGDPVPSDPRREDPPTEDPPAEDPPAREPPREDPPPAEPPRRDPPPEDPPRRDPPAEDPPPRARGASGASARLSAAIVLLAAALASGACSRTPGSRPARAPDGVFEALGDQGAILIAAWPGRWKEGLDALRPALIPALPGPAGAEAIEGLDLLRAEIGSPWGAARAVAAKIDLPAMPESLPGLDPARPLLLAAMIPIDSAEAILADLAAAMVGRRSPSPSGMRHRVVLPATDPAAAAAALDAALAVGMDTVPGMDGVRVGHGRLVRVSKGASWVAVDVVMGIGLGLLDQAGRERFLGPVVPAPARHHPLFAADAASVARVHVRLDRLADAGSSLSAGLMARALVQVGSGDVGAILLQGSAEALTAPLILDPRARLASDFIADLPGSAPAAPVLYVVATEAGRAALRADSQLAAGAAVPVQRVDLAAIARPTRPPEVLQSVKSTSDAAQLVQQCGYVCTLYLALGNSPFLLQTIERAAPGTIATSIQPVLAGSGLFGSARASLVGNVLVVEPLGPAPDAAARARAIEPRPAAASKESDCYVRAIGRVRLAFVLAGAAQPEAAGVALDPLTEAIGPDLDCASASEAFAPRAAKLRELVASLRKLPR